MEEKKKPTRALTFKVILLELLLFVVTIPWGEVDSSYHFSWIICLLLAGYTAWKDYKEGLFDKLTILYLALSLVIVGVMICLILTCG